VTVKAFLHNGIQQEIALSMEIDPSTPQSPWRAEEGD
jgi:hypothetical protein